MTQLLENNSLFAGRMVVRKLSTRHDGEREVYLTKCPAVVDGETEYAPENYVILTVFNLKSKRYEVAGASRKRVPDFIEEIKFLRSRQSDKYFPKIIDCGIEKVGCRRLGWMLQPKIDSNSLTNEIKLQRGLCMTDVVKVMEALFNAVEEIARYTRGGGHYNINPDNILLDYDGNDLNGVYLIGLSDMASSYHGSTPLCDEPLDKRFRAPETVNGVFSHLTDIYALGIVMTMMISGDTGEDEKKLTDSRFSVFSAIEFRKRFMKRTRDKLSAAQRLILEKAADVNPSDRFQTIDRFRLFVGKLAKGNISTQTYVESMETTRTKPIDAEDNDDKNDEGIAGIDLGAEKEKQKTRHGPKCLVEARPEIKRGIAGRGLDEVAGMDELKDLFRRNFVRIVRNPKIAKAYGITPCNCTLLYGPQGCGKTFIAEKAAQESGLKYKIVNPSDLGSIYIHGAQEKIAETFKEAEKNAPMILIFDEFDAIAPKRDGDINPHQANEVNELLTRLNNCAEKGVYVLATTNRPQMLDTAVLRSGRTDMMFYVSLPDDKARRYIFALELKNRPCAEDIDLDILASATENFTCSDLSFVVKECARRCFDETIASGSDKPIPLSQSKILDVIKSTHSSVSEDEIKSYKEMKDKMEHRNENNNRPRVGFLTNI